MTRTAARIFAFFVISVMGVTAWAKVYHWPGYCEAGTLKISNPSGESGYVWLQRFNPQLENESEFLIQEKTSISIKVQNNTHSDRFSLLTFLNAPLEVTYECGLHSYTATEIEGGVNVFRRRVNTENKLWVQSLYSGSQKLKVEYLDSRDETLSTEFIPISAGESRTQLLRADLKWTKFRITSSHRYTSFLVTEKSTSPPDFSSPVSSDVEKNATYFLIGNRSGSGANFVARITDPGLAERARNLIKNPAAEKMMFATIQKDHSGFNRDFNSPQATHWSWSTSEVTNFADFGSTACNGNPQSLEDRVDQWVESPGRICFWDFRVKSELTPEEVSSGTFKTKKRSH